IELSDDPVLAARAAIYSQSYNARLREIGFGKATDAVGK
ncbi:catalase, partial [Acinetobacter baumannii]